MVFGKGEDKRVKKSKKDSVEPKQVERAPPAEKPGPDPAEAARKAEEKRRKEEKQRQIQEEEKKLLEEEEEKKRRRSEQKRKEKEAREEAARQEEAQRQAQEAAAQQEAAQQEAARKAEKDAAREKKAAEKEKAKKKRSTGGSTSSKSLTEKEPVENVEAELTSLESVPVDPQAPEDIHKQLYNLLPKSVYQAYDRMQSFARDLNTSIPVPEVVFVGPAGSGKSSVLEALVGHPLASVETGNNRPLIVQMVNNMTCTTPKITLKRDSVLREFDHDVVVTLNDLSDHLTLRNSKVADEPVILQYESAEVCNMTLIDTPGLLDEDLPDVSQKQRDDLVLSFIRPSNRYIISVETCREWSSLKMVKFVKSVDPELARTTFVFSKFYSFLNSVTGTNEINKFFSGMVPDSKTFFVTLPSQGIRANFSEPDAYKKKVFQAYRRDVLALEQLKFDRRYDANIGVHHFRRSALNFSWREYLDSVPGILKEVRAKRKDTKKQLDNAEKQLSLFTTSTLRTVASTYVVEFLQTVEKLLAGTSEGNPGVTGQTLDEEKNAFGEGDWVDMYHRVIHFDAEEWGVLYCDTRVYGGQQFERLLSEFDKVAGHTTPSDITNDDIASSSGVNKLNNVPNFAWAAADLAQQKSQDVFMPLIEQLTNRAVYVMRRLVDIAEKVMEQRRKRRNNSNSFGVEDISQYPYFTYHVKDLYLKFIDATAKEVHQKCLDEFYSTRTVYWHLTEHSDKQLPMDRSDSDNTREAVVELVNEIFTELRKRIASNVLLKFYNFFLVPIQTDLWKEIQGKVGSLSDKELDQIFEIESSRTKMEEDAKDLEADLQLCIEQEKIFAEYTNAFSHPLAQLAGRR